MKQTIKKTGFSIVSKTIVKIAWKNIWRQKLRSSIVLSAFAIGIFGGLASVGSMKGMTFDLVDNALNNEIAHIQIHNPKYLDNNEVQYTIKETNALKNELSEDSKIESFSMRTKVFGMASTATKATGIMLNGIDPKIETKVSEIYQKLDSNSTWFESSKKNRIIISSKLAETLHAKVKSKIVVTFQDYNGNLTGATFKVEGIYKTQNSMFDEQNVFVDRNDLNQILSIPHNEAHEIAIKLKDYLQSGEEAEHLQKKWTSLKIEPWFILSPYLKMSADMTDFMLLIFMTIILTALGFAIVNTMLMAILERKKELGMIMAIGMNRYKVFQMIMWETLLLALSGSLIGIVITLAFTSYFGVHGIDISAVGEGFASAGYGSVIYPVLSQSDYLQMVALVIVAGFIASIFPAVRALKMKPAEAVRQ